MLEGLPCTARVTDCRQAASVGRQPELQPFQLHGPQQEAVISFVKVPLQDVKAFGVQGESIVSQTGVDFRHD